MDPYFVPKSMVRITYQQSNSTFVGSIGRADTVDQAKAFIQEIRHEMSDATHHVYAFKVGYGTRVIEGMSDDGEPSGTAGPPALAVLRGADMGDVVLVITRYFGGTKLGTGGLVHAYSKTAQEAVAAVPTELKIVRRLIGVEVPYPLYERVKLLLTAHEGDILEQTFEADVLVVFKMPVLQIEIFIEALTELSAGQIQPTFLDA